MNRNPFNTVQVTHTLMLGKTRQKERLQKSSSPDAIPLVPTIFHVPLTSWQLCTSPQAARQ